MKLSLMDKKIIDGVKKTAFIFILYYVITFFGPLAVFYFSMEYFESLNLDSLEITLRLIEITVQCLMILILFFAGKKSNINWLEEKFKISSRNLFFILIITILFRIMVNPLLNFDEILNFIETNSINGLVNTDDLGLILQITIIINIVILAPIVEELMFRGYFLKTLSKLGNWKSILISSTLFTIIHISSNVAFLIVIFMFGIVLSLVAKKLGLIYAIISHIIFNLMGYAIKYLLSNDYWSLLASLKFDIRYWCIVLLAAIAFLLYSRKILDYSNK